MDLGKNIDHGLDKLEKVVDWIDEYDRIHSHPNAVDNTITAAISGVGLAAEATAAKLATKPNTVPNVIGRVSLHGLALSAAAIAGIQSERAYHR